MIQMGLLTSEQKEELLPIFHQDGNQVGQWWQPDSFFNPVQDINDDWYISQQEMYGNINPEFSWVLSLPLQDFIPKPNPD